MLVSLISNVKDIRHQVSAELSTFLKLFFLSVNFKLTSPLHHLVDLSLGRFLNFQNQLFLLFYSKLDVVKSSALVLSFTELPVFDNNVFALGCPPCLIIELFLLA